MRKQAQQMRKLICLLNSESRDILKNLDRNTEIRNKMKEALNSGDVEDFINAQEAYAEQVVNRINKDIETIGNQGLDAKIMAERGLRELTSEETKFYNKVIEKNTFDGLEDLMPKTVFDRVFLDLRANHPILSKVNFQNTTGVTEWVVRTNEVESATWGKLCSEIEKQLEAGFDTFNMNLYKLSAFIPMCKSMLVLSPKWLDRFVREMLLESVSLALEKAIIDGDGNEKPIGLTRDLEGSVTLGVYSEKTAVELNDLEPSTLGSVIMKPFTEGKVKNINKLTILVNPSDYWGKLYGQIWTRNAFGAYVENKLPINAEIVQSVYVPENKMIVTDLSEYFMGIGMNTTIEKSDHYRFLEDDRVYKVVMLGNGRPVTNNAAMVLDITNLGKAIPAA